MPLEYFVTELENKSHIINPPFPYAATWRIPH
jgi:hypothetical protein